MGARPRSKLGVNCGATNTITEGQGDKMMKFVILAHPLPNYAHIRQWNPEGYVQRWMHAFTPNNKYHFSVAPHSNENGFHITSANGRQRVYYDRAGRRVTRPKRPEGPGAVSSVQYPKSDWNHDARLMAAFLNSFRR